MESIHRIKRLRLEEFRSHITDIVRTFGCVELHDRCSGTEITFVEVDIVDAGIGHHIEIVAEIADIGKRAPLGGTYVALSLDGVGIRYRHVEEYRTDN